MDYTRSKVNRKRHLQKREPSDPNLDAFTAMNLHGPDLDTEAQADTGVKTNDADVKDNDVAEPDRIAGSKKKNSGEVNTSGLYDIGNDEDDVEDASARSRNATRQIIVNIAAGDDRTEEELLNVNSLGYVKT